VTAPLRAPRRKAVATWLAVLGGAFGAHRFYLHGWRDAWAWAHVPATLLGVQGLLRMQTLGQDDRLSWLLLPLLGLMVAQAMLAAIVHGLTADDRWNARHNPDRPAPPAGWLAVLGVILALMVGATALLSTIAFSGQRFFEWQIEEARRISQ
jgi:hypothetical protein